MKLNRINIALITVIIALTFAGCQKNNKIEGNGIIKNEVRNSVSFNFVENSGNFEVVIIPDSTFYLSIEAESNLIPHIKTNVNGNTLEISTRENLKNNYPMVIYVHTSALAGVSLSGSGLINAGEWQTNDFQVILSGSGLIYGDVSTNIFIANISGSGEVDFYIDTDIAKSNISGSGIVKLTGNSNTSEYRISGSGSIESFTLQVFECFATISGSGNIYTIASDLIDVKISGSGNLYYKGSPIINSKITGSGQVIRH